MFLSHIHNFRAVAIIGIVGAHSLHAFTWDDNHLIFRLFDTLFNQSSILFFFIAGFLFQYLSSRFEKWQYWRKKVQYVIVPYLLLSIPAIYYYTQVAFQDNTWPGFYEYPLIKQIFFFLITGKHMAPFWFVPTIALFYIMAPALLAVDKRRYLYGFLPLLMILSLILGRDGQYGPLNKAVYLFSVYFFGMFACVHHNRLLEIMEKYHALVLTMAVALIASNVTLPGHEQYFMYSSKLLMCPLLVYYLFKSESFIGTKLNYLGHISFGIFFLHSYILPAVKISYIKMSGNADFPEGNLIAYITLTIAILIACTIIIHLSQKVTGKYSRMLLAA